MSSYLSAEVSCPFYVRDDTKTCYLTCEGMPPGTTIRNHFSSGKELKKHILRRCAGEYKCCPWYKMLWGGKYE